MKVTNDQLARTNQESMIKKDEYYGSGNFYKLTSKKLYSQNEEGGKFNYVPLSKYLKIKKIEQAEESNDVVLTLEYLYQNQYKSTEITRDQLQPNELQKLSKKGIDVFFHNVKPIVQFLRIQEEKAPYITVHNHLGWEETEQGLYYKHNKIIGKPYKESTYKGDFNIKPKGTLEGWKDVMNNYVIGNTNLEIALTFGFSAVVVGLLSLIKDIDTLIVHIYGKSTTGKTTATQVAVSPFGRPTKNLKGMIKSWNATGNAIVTYLRNNHGVPIVLDEASMSNLKDFTSLIYTFAENREKDRMNKEGGLRNQGNWSTTIISTAEHSLFQKTNANEGLRVRAFEFGHTVWTSSAANSTDIKKGVLANYGHAGIHFVEYIQQLGSEEVDERCKKWQKKCEETLPPSSFLSRVSEKFGIIMATAELVNESLHLGLNLNEMMEVLYEVEKDAAAERSQADKAYNHIVEKIVENHSCFLSNDRVFSGRECWGKITYGDTKHEVAILKHKLHQFLVEEGITDKKVVFAEWKEKGYMNTESNKNTNRRKVFNEDQQQLRRDSGLTNTPGSKGEEIVYTILVDMDTLDEFRVNRVKEPLSSEEIKKCQWPKSKK